MKLSFCSNAFVRHSIAQAIRSISEIGYEGVEILADVPHLYADTTSESDLDDLKKLLLECSLTACNLNANTAVGWYGANFWEPLFEPSLANPDEILRNWRINYTRKCIDMAEFLGVPCVSVTSGRPIPGVLPEYSMDLLEESLSQVVEYASSKSVSIGLEYEPGLLIESCRELVELFSRIDSPFLGANLDVGHSFVQGEDTSEVIHELDQRIFHLHLEDIKGRKHFHRIPGDGDICFDSIFDALSEIGYEGFMSVELYTFPHNPEGAASASITFLRELMARKGLQQVCPP